MLKFLSKKELEEQHSSAQAFLETNHLFELDSTIACVINPDILSVMYPQRKGLNSYFVFAADGYLYRLEEMKQGFMLSRIFDTSTYERVKAYVRHLGESDPSIINTLRNFENHAIQADEYSGLSSITTLEKQPQ